METLKNKINTLAKGQTILRDQRKTVHNKLERTIPASEALWKHETNREQLRLMYAAHAILKGKTIEQYHVENPTKKEGKPTILDLKSKIEKIVELHIDEKVVRVSE